MTVKQIELLTKITGLKNKIIASSDKNKIIEYMNEIYSIIDNPDNISINDFRRETMLKRLEMDLNNIKTDKGNIGSWHDSIISRHPSLLNLYAENSNSAAFIRNLQFQ